MRVPLAILMAILPVTSWAVPLPPTKPQRLTIARVVDGDTFVARLEDGRAERVRLAGIDTAELRARCDEELALAIRGRDALVAAFQVAPNKIRILEYGRGRYGRVIADVLVDGQDVGRALVALGVAREWTGRRESWCAEDAS